MTHKEYKKWLRSPCSVCYYMLGGSDSKSRLKMFCELEGRTKEFGSPNGCADFFEEDFDD